MKKFRLAFTVIFSAIFPLAAFPQESSGPDSAGFFIKGNISGVENGTKALLYVNQVPDKSGRISVIPDSAFIADGIVEFRGKLPHDQPLYISIAIRTPQNTRPNVMGKIVYPRLFNAFIQNGKTTTFSTSLSELWKAEAYGSVENEQLNKWKRYSNPVTELVELLNDKVNFSEIGLDTVRKDEYSELIKTASEKLSGLRKAFVEDHPDYVISAILYHNDIRGLGGEEIRRDFEKFSPGVQSSFYGMAILDRVRILEEAARVLPAPDFTRTDRKGNKITISSMKGKVIILDFWGSWCSWCRKNNPHLRELYGKYHSKGLEIIMVAHETSRSLEKNIQSWEKAISEDGLDSFIHILNADGSSGVDLIKLYDVKSYPFTYIVDRDGNIAGKYAGTTGEIDEKLKKLFGY